MKRFGMLAALALCLLLAPACAAGQAMDPAGEAKAACLAAGGEWLETAYTAHVCSPYGTQSVVLRDMPSDSYDALAMLMVGQTVTAAGESGAFCFVMTEEGVFGWLAADEIEAAP